jgi:hypothetical protein
LPPRGSPVGIILVDGTQGRNVHDLMRAEGVPFPGVKIHCAECLEKVDFEVVLNCNKGHFQVSKTRLALVKDFFTHDRKTRHEPMALSALLMNPITKWGYFAQSDGKMIAIEQIVGHQLSPICRRTCSFACWWASCSAWLSRSSSAGSLSAQRLASSAKSRSISSGVASLSSRLSTRRRCPSFQSQGNGSSGRISPFFKTAIGIWRSFQALSVVILIYQRSVVDAMWAQESRLNWAAPYNTHAWPPISRNRTRRVVRVERTLRIGLGIKGASHDQIEFPQLHRLAPAFLRREHLPGMPFIVGPVVGDGGKRQGHNKTLLTHAAFSPL